MVSHPHRLTYNAGESHNGMRKAAIHTILATVNNSYHTSHCKQLLRVRYLPNPSTYEANGHSGILGSSYSYHTSHCKQLRYVSTCEATQGF
jgi:hypothetical protein